ncbi:MAG: DUF547 domain-containing protein [Deltaproteobacteria bacterium]|nr:DUF547 domain-containing protein [Deltaproteobacteria bacterium]
MVPHIVFNPKALGGYFPEPDFWQVPGQRQTSGISMPPLHATACLAIYRHASDLHGAREFLESMYPKLLASHRYFYRERDPDHEGLVYIRHPWESGLDNSPTWDSPLERIDLSKVEIPSYQRKDLGHGVPAEQRPKQKDYDRYIYLVDLFRRHGYQEEGIFRECPFLIQDVLFNSILCRANRDLIEIGQIIDRDSSESREWLKAATTAIQSKLWCDECLSFEAFDLVRGEKLHTATAASFMPLFAGAATEDQAEKIYQYMNSVSFCALRQGNCFTIPNYDMTKADFDPSNYWRGPIWLNINWMLSQGLKAYGYRAKADSMVKDLIQLPIRFGFHEYFDSSSGQGYGTGQFSWTAALFLDLAYRYYDPGKRRLDWFSAARPRGLDHYRILNQRRIKTKEEKPAPSEDLAARLMDGIGRLRDRFYNLERGLVNYAALKSSPEWDRYLDLTTELQSFDPDSLATPEERLAFWINLYNVIVIHGIIELDISASVNKFPNFFRRVGYEIGGNIFTPDDMEHGILRANRRSPYHVRPRFGPGDGRRRLSLKIVDPRVQFALVCGSRSCAPIRHYEASAIDDQLDEASRNFLNSSEVLVVPEKNKIFLSQIFKWYKRDFGGRRGIFQFLLRYLDENTRTEFLKKNLDRIKVEYLLYDWNLNH